jgi:hypothetical protein
VRRWSKRARRLTYSDLCDLESPTQPQMSRAQAELSRKIAGQPFASGKPGAGDKISAERRIAPAMEQSADADGGTSAVPIPQQSGGNTDMSDNDNGINVGQAIYLIETQVGGDLDITMADAKKALGRGSSKLRVSDKLPKPIGEFVTALASIKDEVGEWLTLDREAELVAMAETLVKQNSIGAEPANDQQSQDEESGDGESNVDKALDRLHAVPTVLGDMHEPVPASMLVVELDIPLERVLALYGLDTPGGPETIVDAVAVRSAFERSQHRVADEDTRGELVRYSGRLARVALSGRMRSTRADREVKRKLFDAVALILGHPVHRPTTGIEEVKDPSDRVVAYRVPTLLDPKRKARVETMEYDAIMADPQATFPIMTERQEYELVSWLSELSIVPRACQNCTQDDAFALGLRSKFWNLVDGLEKADDKGRRYILRFYLPGMKTEWTALYRKLGLPTGKDEFGHELFDELKFRKVHDECGIIAHEMRALATSDDFRGSDWFDPQVRQRFVGALGLALRGRLAEIKQKTRNEVGRETVKRRAQGVAAIVFEGLDTRRANRRAGQARVASREVSNA